VTFLHQRAAEDEKVVKDRGAAGEARAFFAGQHVGTQILPAIGGHLVQHCGNGGAKAFARRFQRSILFGAQRRGNGGVLVAVHAVLLPRAA